MKYKLSIIFCIIYSLISAPVALGAIIPAVHGANIYEMIFFIIHLPFLVIIKVMNWTFQKEYYGFLLAIMMAFIFYTFIGFIIGWYLTGRKK
ncbi:MAG: hypothetical protein L3J39_03925 [Verrucomicrobiales bacterium]|nr:hypothetical protein [Verrucomicrobiales bacterium]